MLEFLALVWANKESIAAFLFATVLAVSGLVKLLQGGAHAFQSLAAKTATDVDDRVALPLVRGLDAASKAMDKAADLLRPFSFYGRGRK